MFYIVTKCFYNVKNIFKHNKITFISVTIILHNVTNQCFYSYEIIFVIGTK